MQHIDLEYWRPQRQLKCNLPSTCWLLHWTILFEMCQCQIMFPICQPTWILVNAVNILSKTATLMSKIRKTLKWPYFRDIELLIRTGNSSLRGVVPFTTSNYKLHWFRRCDNIIQFLRQIIVFNETNSVEAY